MYIPLTLTTLPAGVYYVCSLLAPIAMTLAIGQAFALDQSGQGLQFSTVWVSDAGFSYGSSVIMLLIDIVLYFSLALYLDARVSVDGSPKRNPRCWGSNRTQRQSSAPLMGEAEDKEIQRDDERDVERTPVGARVVVSITGMSKTYPRPDLLAGSTTTLALGGSLFANG